MANDTIFLQLGRLDARLRDNIGRTSWQLAMRLRGVALACQNAGIPVKEGEVREWVSGRSLPPRHLVGLEDPLRVPTSAYFYLRAMASACSKEVDESAIIFEKLFNARSQAIEWASDEVQYYEELFEVLIDAAKECQLEASMASVAEALSGLLVLARGVNERSNAENGVLKFSEKDRPALVWLVSVFTPVLLLQSRLTYNLMPQMVPKLRFLDMKKDQIEDVLLMMLEAEVSKGHSSLAVMERSLTSVRDNLLTNRRSKTWEGAVITAAFPDIKRGKLAAMLNLQPQGAGYIKSKLMKRYLV